MSGICVCDILARALKAWQRLTLPHLKMQYHQRKEVSRSSSRWDRVEHSCHNHQAIEARVIVSRTQVSDRSEVIGWACFCKEAIEADRAISTG